MELFMKYPINVQHELLYKLLLEAKNTEWGKQHDYQNINNYHDFINKVPLQSYEDIEPYVSRIKQGEQNILWHSKF